MVFISEKHFLLHDFSELDKGAKHLLNIIAVFEDYAMAETYLN